MIYRKGFGWANAEWQVRNTPTTRFRIGSITKQFTATLILMLAEEGKLRLDGTIREYLPEYRAAQGDRITIHQLLTHTSGIPNYTDLPGFMADVSRNPATPADFVRLFDTLPFDFVPGSAVQLQQLQLLPARRHHRAAGGRAVRPGASASHP